MFLFPVFGEVYKIVTWITPAGYRPVAAIGKPYSQQLEATSKVGPVNYTIIAGTPPAGITLSSSGLLSGTPTTSSNQMFTVRASVISDPTIYADREIGIATKSIPGFVVLSNANIYLSDDMMTWTSHPYPGGAALEFGFDSIAYGNDIFVGIWHGSGTTGVLSRIYASQDGITWSEVMASTYHSSDFYKVVFGNGVFMVSGMMPQATSPMAGVWTSPDGLAWTQRSTHRIANGALWYGGGKFFSTTAEDTNLLLVSTDNGVTWTSGARARIGNNWTRVIYHPVLGLYHTRDNDGFVYTSGDGWTWTQHAITLPAGGIIAVLSNYFLWVPTSNGGTTYQYRTSLDGVTWTLVPGFKSWTGVPITIDEGITVVFAGVGLDARVHSTTDGTNFIDSPKLAFNPNLYAIASSRVVID